MNSNDLDNYFTYHRPTDDQLPRFGALRADQTVAVRCVRDAVMNANAAIACNEGN